MVLAKGDVQCFNFQGDCMSFKNQTIVIIGGNSGIGLATARAVIAQDGQVIIAGRSTQKLKKAQLVLGKNTRSFELDVTEEEQVKGFFQQIGPFNHLVTSVGVAGMGNFKDLETSAARSLFECKFWGQYNAAKYGISQIKVGGSITFFSGIGSRKPFPGLAPVAAINGAIEALCRTLAVELSPIRVNVIAPGVIDTPAHNTMPAEKKKLFLAGIGGKLPAKRVGTAEEVAELVLFLMANGFCTGTVIDIDGGHRLI